MSGLPIVFMLDDDVHVLEVLSRLLVSAGFTVQAFPSADAFHARAAHTGPTCLILDHVIPGQTGLELLDSLDPPPWWQIVFLSGHADVDVAVQAMRHGAFDFIVKPVNQARLVDVVTRALAESARLLQVQDAQQEVAARLDTLTTRERQVCEALARGLLNKQIAAELGASEKTIKIHRARVMQKLGVSSVIELARLLERRGTVPPRSGNGRLPQSPEKT